MTAETPLDPEDTKIITLAKATLARSGADQAACLRDTDGRTYTGAAVDLAHLRLSAIQVAVAMAVSSGAQGVEAVAVSGTPASADDLAVVADLPGERVLIWSTDASGAVLDRRGLDRRGLDRTGLDRTGLDRTGLGPADE